MGCLIISLINLLAALSLWRLWATDHNVLWWCILSSAVASWFSAEAVRNAYKSAVSGARVTDEFEAVMADMEAKNSPAVRFCANVSMVLTAITLILSVVGLVLSFL